MPDYAFFIDYSEAPLNKAGHFHDCHQILYIKEGKIEAAANGEKFEASSGNLIVFGRFEQHSVTVKSDTYKRYTIRLYPQISSNNGFSVFSNMLNRAAAYNNKITVLNRKLYFDRLLFELNQEYNSSNSMKEEMLLSLFSQFMISLCRLLPEEIAKEDTDESRIVIDIERRFENGFKDDISLDELSKQYHISKSYLCHLFKKVSGHAVMEYLQSCRLAAAKKYLSKTDMPVGRIVESCGFSNDSNFSRTFKKQTGMTPSQFRKKYNDNYR